jgi:hypothetical protein
MRVALRLGLGSQEVLISPRRFGRYVHQYAILVNPLVATPAPCAPARFTLMV